MSNDKNKKEGNTGSGDKSKKPFPKKNFKKPFKKEGSDSVIEKRNDLLAKLFRLIDIPVRIILIGEDNNPVLIYNDEVVLNTDINNFELNFTDAPNSKKAVYTVKLNENPRFDKNRILQCISEYPTKAVFKVSLKTTPKLYLTGYNFLNKADKLGRYPVFSSYNPKIYLTEDKAKEIVGELNNDGYQAVFE